MRLLLGEARWIAESLPWTHALDAPASLGIIEQEGAEYGGPLPAEYVELLRVSDGTYTAGRLTLLGAEGIVQRNVDGEVLVLGTCPAERCT